jgi:hypothetical protein
MQDKYTGRDKATEALAIGKKAPFVVMRYALNAAAQSLNEHCRRRSEGGDSQAVATYTCVNRAADDVSKINHRDLQMIGMMGRDTC